MEVGNLGKPYSPGVYGGISCPYRACPGWRRRASVAPGIFAPAQKAQSSDWAFCLI